MVALRARVGGYLPIHAARNPVAQGLTVAWACGPCCARGCRCTLSWIGDGVASEAQLVPCPPGEV